jgi:hypothetical protein
MERFLPAEEQRAIEEDIRHLKTRKNLTYLLDGWEDAMRRSVYGSLLAEVGEHPIILGLHELTGRQATADNLIEISVQALERKEVNPQMVIAVCTDNPTTMQAFRRKYSAKYPWVIVSTLSVTLKV